jgi:hypothetical protein
VAVKLVSCIQGITDNLRVFEHRVLRWLFGPKRE